MRQRKAHTLILLLIAIWVTSAQDGQDAPPGHAPPGPPGPAPPGPSPRRKGKSDRSTSSSSGERAGSDDGDKAESLDMSMSGSSSDSEAKKDDKYKPKSTEERHGWRKWHRKCHPCPDEMELKWRDPRINWICGGYQRARRSFKSDCMMRYRNCQDGTMFVKIHPHRCANDTPTDPRPHGDHFFYDYRVMLSVDSSGSESSSVSSEESDKSNSDVDTSKLPDRRHKADRRRKGKDRVHVPYRRKMGADNKEIKDINASTNVINTTKTKPS